LFENPISISSFNLESEMKDDPDFLSPRERGSLLNSRVSSQLASPDRKYLELILGDSLKEEIQSLSSAVAKVLINKQKVIQMLQAKIAKISKRYTKLKSISEHFKLQLAEKQSEIDQLIEEITRVKMEMVSDMNKMHEEGLRR